MMDALLVSDRGVEKHLTAGSRTFVAEADRPASESV
jgi:hypothetical protein